jgi:antitoxin PrlF
MNDIDIIYDTCKINDNGRIVIPVEIRRAMGLSAGDSVVLTFEDGVLRVESQQARIRQVQESLRKMIPARRRLSQELIEERSEEVRQEVEEWLG